MSQTDLFNLVQQVQDQYGTLFAHVITINFAMIVAIYYFLHRTRFVFRIAAFGVYLIGMLTLVGLMLQQANFKKLVLQEMQAMASTGQAAMVANFLQLQESWLFQSARLFQNLSLWILIVVIGYMLFFWKNPTTADRSVA